MMSFLNSKKITYTFFAIIVFLQIAQLFFFKRDLLLSNYDVSYWKDRVEHSQWVLPLSQRTIGDDGLFAYVGYTLVKGADPSIFNAETGPTGKYILGLSILLFHNPYLIIFLLTLISGYLIFFISLKLIRNTIVSFFIVMLFLGDPIIISEYSVSSVDITQVFFMLLFFCFWLSSFSGSKYRWLFVGLAGISLSFFSTVKLPIIAPILFFSILLSILAKKYFKEIVIFVISFMTGFIIPYFQYFRLGHSLVDFIKLQKYIISFYTKSHLSVHHSAVWQIVFLRKFPDIVNGNSLFLPEWWIVWPIGVILTIIIFWIYLQKKKNYWIIFITFYIILSLVIFTFIPTYPRYLLLITPFLYIILGLFCNYLLKKKNMGFIFIIFSLIIIYFTYTSLIPSSNVVLNDFVFNLSHSYFQDVYEEDIANASLLDMNRQQFAHISQKTFFDGEIEKIVFTPTKEINKGNEIHISGIMTYTTRNLGSFSEKKTIQLVLVNGVWKIRWYWGYLVNGFLPGDSLITTIDPGKRGSVLDKNGNILANDTIGYLISIKPSVIDRARENKMLALLNKVSGVKAVYLQNAYLENPLSDTFIPLFTPMYQLDLSTIDYLLSYPGIKITSYITRLYKDINNINVENTKYEECCTRIYSSSTYHGVSGWEKKYDLSLSGNNGGRLVLEDKKKKVIRVILQQKLKNGENVQI